MRKYSLIAIAVATAALFLAAAPSQAQITSYVDGHGHVVYINANSPKSKSGSTMSSSPGVSPGSSPSGAVEDVSENPPGTLDRIVSEAARRHSLDPNLVKAVISTESGWNPRAISRKGAIGLMQLEPGTAERFGVQNPFDPTQNVEGGSAYLKSLLDRYNGDLTKTLAAYNAGEHAVDSSGGVPPIPETERYVQKVTNRYFQPGSSSSGLHWTPRPLPIRKEVETGGQVVFTNQ